MWKNRNLRSLIEEKRQNVTDIRDFTTTPLPIPKNFLVVYLLKLSSECLVSYDPHLPLLALKTLDTTQLPHSAKAKGPPAARACHPHAERRNCNFLEFTNRPSTPKPPPKAHRPPLSIHNQSDSQRQWITFHLICVPRARARGSKFHAETNFYFRQPRSSKGK
jgi:hypothetical protein